MKKKRYFSRGVMFLLCAMFAVMFLLPTVLTITNSFMSEAEIQSNYGMVFSTTSGGYVSKTVNLKFIPDKVTLSQYVTGLIKSPEYLIKFWNSMLPLPKGAFTLPLPCNHSAKAENLQNLSGKKGLQFNR